MHLFKRLTVVSTVLMMTVSCEINSGQSNVLTSEDLESYTMDIFGGHVIMPMLMAEYAIDLDAYLALSEEEKRNDYRFYGKIFKNADDCFVIDDGKTFCSVRTGGVSIWEPGASWEFLSFSTSTNLLSHGKLYCNMSDPVTLESYPTAEGDDTMRLFSMAYGEDYAGLELKREDADGNYVWNIGTSGKIEDTDGYWSEFMTDINGIEIICRDNQALGELEYICSGSFLVNIFRNDEPLDWCRAQFNEGYMITFDTSL